MRNMYVYINIHCTIYNVFAASNYHPIKDSNEGFGFISSKYISDTIYICKKRIYRVYIKNIYKIKEYKFQTKQHFSCKEQLNRRLRASSSSLFIFCLKRIPEFYKKIQMTVARTCMSVDEVTSYCF